MTRTRITMFHSDPNHLGMKLPAKIAILAIIALVLTAWPLFKFYEKSSRIKGWHQTYATIKNVEAYKGRSGRRLSLGSSLSCKYTYVYNNKTYTSHRIALFPLGDDDLDKWESNLKNAHQGQTPVPCFINPDDPAESVLTTDISQLKFSIYGLITATSSLYLIVWLVFCKPWKFKALEAE